MDPKTCYEEMESAVLDGDFESARERAKDLRRWICRSGFVPDVGLTKNEILDKITEVLKLCDSN